MKKLIIDTDPGVDDVQAIVMAFAYPELVKVLAITIVAGNGSLEQGYTNATKMLRFIGQDSIPVYKGSAYNLQGNFVESNTHFGSDSLGENSLPKVTDFKPENLSAAEALVKLTREHPNEIELVALGPLTNLALAFLLDRDFPKRLKALHIMGGDRSEKTFNNINEWAEFNCWIDPVAFDFVFKNFGKVGGVPIKVVEFTFCNEHGLTVDYLEQLYGISSKTKEEDLNIYGQFNKHFCSFMSRYWNTDLITTADPFSMYLCLFPDVPYKSKLVRLESVSLLKENYGHCVFKENPDGNIEMIYDIDMEDFLRVWKSAMYRK